MILTLAFVSGFQQAIAEKVFNFWGHIRVQQHPSYSADLSDELPSRGSDTVLNILKNNPAVKSVDMYASKASLLKSASNMEGIILKGVNANFSKERMQPFLVKGQWLSFDSTLPSVVISAHTARVLELDTGQRAYLYFMSREAAAPKIRPVKVVGIYKTAIEEYDRSIAIVDMSLIQKLQEWNRSQFSGYEVTLHDYRQDHMAANDLLDELPVSWYATPMKDIYPNIFDWLDLQDTNRALIIVIMCIVAVINLISCLLILVLERTKMIGLLKALGSRDSMVQGIFWRQGIYISLKGIFWGNITGLLICFLQKVTGFIRLDESAYYLREAPVRLIGWHLLAVNAGTFIVCVLLLSLPALLVRKIEPVRALRFD